mgnify:CR=1 FL=1
MEDLTYVSDFLPDVVVSVIYKDSDKYHTLKPMFDEYGFGFMVPNQNLIIIGSLGIDGNSFISNDYTVCPSDYFDNANDRIVGYYEPDALMPVIDTIVANITLSNSAVASNTIYANLSWRNGDINGASVSNSYTVSEDSVIVAKWS